MPNTSQAENEKTSAIPNRTELWNRIVEVLKTDNQAEIARRLGVQPPSVSEWKSGKSLPKAAHLIKIANVGNTYVDYLLTGREFIQQEKSLDGNDIYGMSGVQQVLTHLNNDLVDILRSIAENEADNLFANLQIPHEQKTENAFHLLLGLLIHAGLKSFDLLNKEIDFRHQELFLQRFSFNTKNFSEREIRDIVREEMENREREMVVQNLGTLDEFDVSRTLEETHDPHEVMRRWFTSEGREYPEDFGVVFFQGWETFTEAEKIDAVHDAKKVLDRNPELKKGKKKR